jgi:hypothetical protein
MGGHQGVFHFRSGEEVHTGASARFSPEGQTLRADYAEQGWFDGREMNLLLIPNG